MDDLRPAPGGEGGLRLPLQDVYKFDGRRILAGRVEAGRVRVGDEVMISPGGKVTKVTSLAAWLERDLKDEASAGESVGLIVSDEFFNRRGEVVSLPGSPPVTSGRIRASVFCLGRKPLKLGARHPLKLAASETEATVGAILNLIDSETLSPIPAAGEVGQNEVAAVELALKKPLALDLFSRHKATGRFVLLDGYDVCEGGIVTAAFPAADIRQLFVSGSASARCEVFEEYYYSLGDLSVNKAPKADLSYAVGDPVPLAGQSYEYPESFDIAVFRDRAAVLIREGKVAAIETLEEYRWRGLPLVNGRGFGLSVGSGEDWERAKADFLGQTPETEASVAKRWLDFNAYRRIPIGLGDFAI